MFHQYGSSNRAKMEFDSILLFHNDLHAATHPAGAHLGGRMGERTALRRYRRAKVCQKYPNGQKRPTCLTQNALLAVEDCL
jgi:hypothetical protein